MDLFEKEISKIIIKQGIKNVIIETPPSPELGDYAVPCFSFAKTLKKAPDKIAEELSKKIKSPLFEKIEAKGAYINFFAKSQKLAQETLKKIDTEYGKSFAGKNQKVMIEFSSPNTNKPLHLGHIRNILIGESLSRIFEATGHNVIRSCLVNDRGVHISKSMLAYKMWGKNKKPSKKFDHFVGDWYIKYNKEYEKNKELEKDIQQMLVDWENNDKKTIALWEKMNNWVYKGFDQTYKSIGIKFDKIYYESDFYDKGKKIVQDSLKKRIFKTDKNKNIIAELSKHGFNDDKVILRADGTSVYITQDIYLAKKKFDDYKLSKSLYVVGSEQNLHFKQLFKILELLKLADINSLKHISYGMVYLPKGKMKSREGTVVDADNLIDEVKELAKKEIEKRYKLSKKELEKRADIIGLGALKFFILKMDPARDMTYNPKESVSFEGETGPYIQYAHARINSIFEKGKIKSISKNIDFGRFDDYEKGIIKKLSDYPKTVVDSMNTYKPSLITRYLLDLAQMFNEYYHSHPILKAEPKVKDARLKLIDAIRFVIKDGLELFGIEAPEKM